MDNNRPLVGVRDLLWVAVILIAVAAWIWDRSQLAKRLERISPAMPQTPALPVITPGGGTPTNQLMFGAGTSDPPIDQPKPPPE